MVDRPHLALPELARADLPAPLSSAGGLVSYGRTLISPWVVQLAAREGWAVVSPEYRLLLGKGAGAADGCLDDVLAAYAWAFISPEGQAFDRERVGVVGLSAGVSVASPWRRPAGLLADLSPRACDLAQAVSSRSSSRRR